MPERVSDLPSPPRPLVERGPQKRGLLGEILLRRGAIDQDVLNAALARQTAKEVSLGDLLCHQSLISRSALNEALAEQWSLGWIDPDQAACDAALARKYDPATCLALGALPWRQVGLLTILLVDDPNRAEEAIEVLELDPAFTSIAMADGASLRRCIERTFSDVLAQQAVTSCPDEFSCRNWGDTRYSLLTLMALFAAPMLAVIFPQTALIALIAWIFISNLATNFLRVVALVTVWHERGIRRQKMPDLLTPLPKLSMLVPLHDESEVLAQLISNLRALDYPRELLDVKIVLEASDTRTQLALQDIYLPEWIEPVIVPDDTLKTKPRAMNFALPFCKGEIVGVYDAEDQPDRNQLSLVARYLIAAPKEVACVQGYLDFYNPTQNWLSRCFTIEYASWFRVILRGVERLGIPVPLGGTTVFFRTEVLKKLGAWDAHNVTEDADLGIRLARLGYTTEMIETTTREEANCHAKAWIKQRSRWLKGYIITWAVHMRTPAALVRDLGWRGFLGFQVIFLAGMSSYITAPFLWVLWLASVGVPLGILDVMPDAAWGVFLGSLMFGLAVNAAVALRATIDQGKRKLVPWVLTMPIYWLLGALAALKACYELFHAPFYWDKTAHGLSGSRPASD